MTAQLAASPPVILKTFCTTNTPLHKNLFKSGRIDIRKSDLRCSIAQQQMPQLGMPVAEEIWAGPAPPPLGTACAHRLGHTGKTGGRVADAWGARVDRPSAKPRTLHAGRDYFVQTLWNHDRRNEFGGERLAQAWGRIVAPGESVRQEDARGNGFILPVRTCSVAGGWHGTAHMMYIFQRRGISRAGEKNRRPANQLAAAFRGPSMPFHHGAFAKIGVEGLHLWGGFRMWAFRRLGVGF